MGHPICFTGFSYTFSQSSLLPALCRLMGKGKNGGGKVCFGMDKAQKGTRMAKASNISYPPSWAWKPDMEWPRFLPAINLKRNKQTLKRVSEQQDSFPSSLYLCNLSLCFNVLQQPGNIHCNWSKKHLWLCSGVLFLLSQNAKQV